MDNNTIYSDELVDVLDDGIRLKMYYFPSVTAKFVKFSDILKIEKRLPTLMNGKWRYWGSGDFITWFPLDYNRPKRSFIFFLRLATQKIRVGFTVENPEAFIEAINAKGMYIENP
jgi:hypothetical protein